VGSIAVDWAGSLSVVVSVELIIVVIVVIGCVVSIIVVVIIIIQKVVVSRSKPARMLAFSSSKSMCCSGTVMGWDGRGVVRVGSIGCNGGIAVVGIVVDIVGCGGIIRKSSAKSSLTSLRNFVNGGALRVGAVAGVSSLCIFPVVAVFECVICIVIAGGVVISSVVCVVRKSCCNCARKLVSSASRSVLCGGGAMGGRDGGEGVALGASGGGVVDVHLVVVESRLMEFRPLGFVVWFVFVFFVLSELNEGGREELVGCRSVSGRWCGCGCCGGGGSWSLSRRPLDCATGFAP